MIDLPLHLILFTAAGAGLVLAPLVLGLFVRPNLPTEEKKAVYECGEPTIGSSYIQFDIRFYVVALLFIIFDVEVAFFFPWAAVYGNSIQLADARLSEPARQILSDKVLNLPPGTSTPETSVAASDALAMAQIGFADILVFFGVLLVGFAYVWYRGDLDWVRALVRKAKPAVPRFQPTATEASPARELVG